MKKDELSSFFDQACVISLYILFFYIPISSALIETFFGFAWFFFLGRLFTKDGLIGQVLKRERIVSLFFVALAFSLINSGAFLPISLNALFFKWGKYIILYLIISQTLINASRIKCALASLSLGAGLVILDCFFQLCFKLEFLRHRPMILHSNHIWAVTGPFSHNNDFAAYLICVMIIILYWVFSKGATVLKGLAAIIFISGIFILTHAYSRAGWIAFILSIFVLAFILQKFWFLGFSLLATIFLGFKINVLKFLIFHDSGRFELWGVSWKMIKAHPVLGNGIGTFMAWFRSFSPTGNISYAHNCFLQLWAEAGLISLVVFILLIFTAMNRGLLMYRTTQDPIFVILFCALLAYLCTAFFDTNLFSSQVAFLFWVILGLLKGCIGQQALFISSEVTKRGFIDLYT